MQKESVITIPHHECAYTGDDPMVDLRQILHVQYKVDKGNADGLHHMVEITNATDRIQRFWYPTYDQAMHADAYIRDSYNFWLAEI